MTIPHFVSSTKKCPVNRLLNHCSFKNTALYSFDLFTTINVINPTIWNRVVGDKKPFLNWTYLSSLEKGSNAAPKQYYALIREGAEIMGIALFQVTYFQGKSIKDLIINPNPITEYIAKKLGFLESKIQQKIVVCGNVFTTGQDAFAFTKTADLKRGIQTISSVISSIEDIEKNNGTPTGTLLKDFSWETDNINNIIKDSSYIKLETEPTLILAIDDRWNSFEDYMQTLVSKFRVKAKRAYTKSSSIKMVSFTAPMIGKFSPDINKLYMNVINRCDYYTGILDSESLYHLKKTLGKSFLIDGYFLNGKLVGFKTSYFSNHTVFAQIVGLDYTINREYGIYSRILYDYIKTALAFGADTINFGRTASEIKSSLGAIPVPTHCYIKHKNPLMHFFLAILANNVKPEPFTQRKPFKKQWYIENYSSLKNGVKIAGSISS